MVTVVVSNPTIASVVNNPTIVREGRNITYNTGSNYISCVAGIGGVAAYHVVYLNNGVINTASIDDINIAGKVIGIVLSTLLKDASGNVQISGEVTYALWSLTAGSNYYLTLGGELTKTLPTSGFIQKIGIAKSTTTLLLDLGEPIILV